MAIAVGTFAGTLLAYLSSLPAQQYESQWIYAATIGFKTLFVGVAIGIGAGLLRHGWIGLPFAAVGLVAVLAVVPPVGGTIELQAPLSPEGFRLVAGAFLLGYVPAVGVTGGVAFLRRHLRGGSLAEPDPLRVSSGRWDPTGDRLCPEC